MSFITLCFNMLLVAAFCLSVIWLRTSARFTILRWTSQLTDTSQTFPRVLASLERDHSHILSLSSLPNTIFANFARCRRTNPRVKVKARAAVKAAKAARDNLAEDKDRETPWTEWTLSMITLVGTKWTTRQSRLPRSELRSL